MSETEDQVGESGSGERSGLPSTSEAQMERSPAPSAAANLADNPVLPAKIRNDPFAIMMHEREKHLTKYGPWWRCDICRGEWDTKKQALLHFDMHDPFPLLKALEAAIKAGAGGYGAAGEPQPGVPGSVRPHETPPAPPPLPTGKSEEEI